MPEEVTPSAVPVVEDQLVETPEALRADPIGWAEGEFAARIEWVKSRMAAKVLQPAPGIPWAGRTELINELISGPLEPPSANAKGFDPGSPFDPMSPTDAANLVDATVTAVFSVDRPDDLAAQKQFSLMRLRALRQIGMENLGGAREFTWKYEPHPTIKGKMMKVPFKEKITEGVNVAMLSFVQAVENQIQDLLGLKEAKAINQFNTLQVLMGNRKKPETDSDKGSMAAAARNRSINQLLEDPEAQRKLEAAIDEIDPNAPKPAADKSVKRKRGRPKTNKMLEGDGGAGGR